MKIKLSYWLLIGIFAMCLTCKKPFSPTIVSTDNSYLVVEGVINSGSDSTIIKLSRTVKLANNQIKTETGANVIVQGSDNTTYQLTETATGVYTTIGLNLPAGNNYRLHITTANGKVYQSDYEQNKITPPIDSIGYTVLSTGVQFNITSHNDNNTTRYYRWDFDETWTYYSSYASILKYDGTQVVPRGPDSLINLCYRHATPSNSIFLGTTNQLAKDLLYQAPIGYVDASTAKLAHVYSLNVKQYALDANAYNYWQTLKKNTQALGSIFDAQPSTSGGNLHCITNSAEPVIGFISVSTITTKRIFLQGRLLPFLVTGYHDPAQPDDCAEKIILIAPANTFDDRIKRVVANGDSLLVTTYAPPGSPVILGYVYAYKVCVDCRLLGGTTVKPSYWPN